MDGGRREAEHGKVYHKESSDDEEVELLSHRKGAGGTDPPGADIRDTPEVSDAQRDEWLFKTEPLQGLGRDGKKMGDPRCYLIRRGLLKWRPPGGGQSEGGTARCSDPDVAVGAADFAGGGDSRTWGLSDA